MAVCGRYILNPAIFKHLKLTKSDKSGEIQLTDAIRSLLKKKAFMQLFIMEKNLIVVARKAMFMLPFRSLRDESINKKIKKIIQDIV